MCVRPSELNNRKLTPRFLYFSRTLLLPGTAFILCLRGMIAMALIVLASVLSENTRSKGTCVIPKHIRQSSVYYIPVPEPSQHLPPPFFALSRSLRTDKCPNKQKTLFGSPRQAPATGCRCLG